MELQVTVDPATLHVVSEVTVFPAENVWTECVLVAPVRQLTELDEPPPGLLGLVGELPPPVHAIAPTHTSTAPKT